MVDITGHIAFGLLFLLPAWFLQSRRVSITFAALGVLTSLLPDVDLWLVKPFPDRFHHHSVTHTVVLASIAAGILAAAVLTEPLECRLGRDRFDATSMFAFPTLAFLLGGLSHVFADIPSALDISILAVMLLVHVVVALVVDPETRRYESRNRPS